ncbi:hypothetical protein [Kitasatospora sp. MBT66]|uniref:hypothetical protein n=1 Tax=Kitasatospora sp. MBT66 TaxID=1444769 RepID=UPI0005B8FDBD|nr:hypothetical protein [Kitasatospora sp. MBT66]
MGWRKAEEAGLRVLENPDGRYPDPYLELLRLGVQHTGDRLVVTLYLAGGVVTGQIITLDEWEKRILREIKQQSSGVRNSAGGPMGVLDERADEQETDRSDADSPFVHLRDALYRRSGCEPLNVPTWRGPIAAITGWSVGEPPAA